MGRTQFGTDGSDETTQRDLVWAAMLAEGKRWDGKQFQVSDIRRRIDIDDRPSDETIRRVLRSATAMGVVTHRRGSPTYKLTGDL